MKKKPYHDPNTPPLRYNVEVRAYRSDMRTRYVVRNEVFYTKNGIMPSSFYALQLESFRFGFDLRIVRDRRAEKRPKAIGADLDYLGKVSAARKR